MRKDLSLSYTELMYRSKKLCMKFGLNPPTELELYEQYYAEVPQPIVLDNEEVRVWIDRYYMAYQLRFEEVVFVYLTRTYINEEKYSRVVLQKEFKEQFKIASRQMNAEDVSVWIRSDHDVIKIGA